MPRFDSFSKRHPALTLTLLNVILLLVIVIILELVLRFYLVEYTNDFYSGTKKEGVTEYPYGKIITNSLGHADEEFDLSETRPRIGYFGDSVNYGVGAGYPYRFSDLNKAALSDYAHWNVGGGLGVSVRENAIIRVSGRYDLKYAVYLLNLNDIILPQVKNESLSITQKSVAPSSEDVAEKAIRQAKIFMRYFDGLRGRSYLYTYLRFKAKTLLQLAGFEASGFRAYELWPEKNRAVFETFSSYVNEIHDALAADNITLCVVLLPYEMQISSAAERVYEDMGFTWEDGFTEGSPQALLKELLTFPSVYDPIPMFDRDSAEIGEYFVYDKGDKIDWNHPNRKGHAIISEGFLQSSACPFLNP